MDYQINLNAGPGVAVKEYRTDVGPVDYLLFVDSKPCDVVEAKKADEGHRINIHEGQGEDPDILRPKTWKQA